MNCMDWNLFWSAFGAIGGTLGAFATAAAVIVALWQTKFSQRKKLKVEFIEDTAVVLQSSSSITKFISVRVTNIGNRDVVIDSWGFVLNEETSMLILPDASSLGKAIQVTLPHKLALEESISLYYRKELFAAAVTENCNNHNLNALKPIKFYVTDSTGKKYYVETKKKAGTYCN